LSFELRTRPIPVPQPIPPPENLGPDVFTDTGQPSPRERSYVMVYHGSYNNYRSVMRRGFELGTGSQPGCSRDIRVAQDAISDRRLAVEGLSPSEADRGIIPSKIPQPVFEEVLQPYEKPYGGFYPYTITGSTEILLKYDFMKATFNQYIVRSASGI
jgi:hypothetical protein